MTRRHAKSGAKSFEPAELNKYNCEYFFHSRSLVTQLKKLQTLITLKSTRTAQASTCVMVNIYSFFAAVLSGSAWFVNPLLAIHDSCRPVSCLIMFFGTLHVYCKQCGPRSDC